MPGATGVQLDDDIGLVERIVTVGRSTPASLPT